MPVSRKAREGFVSFKEREDDSAQKMEEAAKLEEEVEDEDEIYEASSRRSRNQPGRSGKEKKGSKRKSVDVMSYIKVEEEEEDVGDDKIPEEKETEASRKRNRNLSGQVEKENKSSKIKRKRVNVISYKEVEEEESASDEEKPRVKEIEASIRQVEKETEASRRQVENENKGSKIKRKRVNVISYKEVEEEEDVGDEVKPREKEIETSRKRNRNQLGQVEEGKKGSSKRRRVDLVSYQEDEEEEEEVQRKKYIKEKKNEEKGRVKYQVDERVGSKYDSDIKFPGRVVQINKGSTYNIAFEDGDEREGVPSEDLCPYYKLIDDGSCMFYKKDESSKEIPVYVINGWRRGGKSKISVQSASGDVLKNVPIDCLTRFFKSGEEEEFEMKYFTQKYIGEKIIVVDNSRNLKNLVEVKIEKINDDGQTLLVKSIDNGEEKTIKYEDIDGYLRSTVEDYNLGFEEKKVKEIENSNLFLLNDQVKNEILAEADEGDNAVKISEKEMEVNSEMSSKEGILDLNVV